MKTWTKLVAILAIVALVSAVNAADPAKPAKAKRLRGQVIKVDGTNLVIKSGKKGEEKEVTVATDAKTVVTIDGKDGKLADLKEGQRVQITPDTGTAEKIEVRAPKAK
jgi:ribosomal protein L14E/L6E/L27E